MEYRLANPYTLVLLAVALTALGLAAVAYRHRSNRAALPLGLFLVAEAIWAFGDALRIAALDPWWVLLWNEVAYLGIVLAPPGYILFFAAYSDRQWWFRRRTLLALAGISGLAYLTIVTNRWHHLWLTSHQLSPGTAPPVLDETWGPAWYVWAVYGYSLVVLGVYYAVDQFRLARRTGTDIRQATLLLVAVLVPIVGNVLFLVDLLAFDPQPFAFGLTGAAFTVAVFRYRLLDVRRIARDVVVENMDSGVLVLDPEERVVDANERALAIVGADREDLVGREVWPLLSNVEGSLDWFRDARDAHEIVTFAADRTRHFDVDVSPITDDVGSYLGRVVVFTDVTDAVQRREQLREQADRLQAQNERLEEYAGVVSHDLRNPLQVAKGNLDLLDDDQSVDAIERALDRMETIVDDVLTLTRAGEVVDDPDPVDLRKTARLAWGTVEHGDGSLDVRVPDGTTVRADRDRLVTLLENLYRNAIEHNDGAAITVGTLDADGFYVADDGQGIPADDRETVFEHGYTTRDDGTGFGLAIVADIAEAHGWTVECTEGEAGGARFEFRT